MIEEKIISLLTKQKKTVSLAESCTGGLLGERLTSVSGASKVFGFGVVSYSAKAKQKLLGVKASLIKKEGQVSEAVAFAMAQGILKISQSDYALAITGIAGPTGGTLKKPVGTVCLSLISKDRRHNMLLVKNRTLHLKGSRHHIRKKASDQILKMLYDCLTNLKREVS